MQSRSKIWKELFEFDIAEGYLHLIEESLGEAEGSLIIRFPTRPSRMSEESIMATPCDLVEEFQELPLP